MKKLSIFLFTFMMIFFLPSCKKRNDSFVISEFIENGFNSAIELYNGNNKEINLENYHLEFYFTTIKKVFLKGTLPAKTTYVIAYESEYLIDELRQKADLLLNQFLFSGKNAIALKKEKKIIDILGTTNDFSTYCEQKSIVRKEKYLRSTTKFDEYEWIRYSPNDYSHLKSVRNDITEEELLEGPKLTLEDMARPFYNESNSSLGGGGVVPVTVASYGDGDTTNFYFPSELGVGNVVRVRYQNVDTRETMEHLTQEWGVPAKNFTNSELQKASLIRIQSVLNGSIFETFGRMLGWIWVDDELLNFKLVKEGYSEVQFGESDSSYKGILYTDFLYHAELYAKRNKLKLHGEKDPTWNYETNEPKRKYNYV